MLRYYYKGKADYIKDYPVYLGGDLKKKFINNINSGEKYYTINDFKLEDVLPEIHEKFKDDLKGGGSPMMVQGKIVQRNELGKRFYDCVEA